MWTESPVNTEGRLSHEALGGLAHTSQGEGLKLTCSKLSKAESFQQLLPQEQSTEHAISLLSRATVYL